MKFRIEQDSMGKVEVEATKYWGAQTQRCLNNFDIGTERMPISIIRSYAIVKKACAIANFKCGVLSEEKANIICEVCEEIKSGKLDEHFPLPIWQTGSGTHTNMNVNEVIVNRGQELYGGSISDKNKILHPNDDVNKSQSSNDTFPTVMNISAYIVLIKKTIPAVTELIEVLKMKSNDFSKSVKIGRTHLMDAAPISLGQEFSGYVSHLSHSLEKLENSLDFLSELALGGTAVGTGLNAPLHFDKNAIAEISIQTGITFYVSDNKFEALAGSDAILQAHSCIKNIAVSVFKIVNDLRLMSSGPRCGLNEIFLPENEPGSSIMPGKVNPTQIEATAMICSQIIGNESAITIGNMSGQFQLNVYRPLIIKNFLDSAILLSDALVSLTKNCIIGIEANNEQLKLNLERSLMLVTVLNTHIGYDKAAKIVKKAYKENISLKQACMDLQYISEQEYDNIVNPYKMI